MCDDLLTEHLYMKHLLLLVGSMNLVFNFSSARCVTTLKLSVENE